MNEVERLIDQLEREYSGDPWHGSSLTAILEAVTAERAALRPLAGAHSIWELVLHMTAWKNEVRHRLTGGLAGEPREGDWPLAGDATVERWAQARERLQLAHQLLVSALKEFREENLHVPTNDHRAAGLAPTYYELLIGLLQHDVYHSGQIAILARTSR